jgi:hypothetical protein
MGSRTVRLLLSGIFRDFGEERDLLVKRVLTYAENAVKVINIGSNGVNSDAKDSEIAGYR